MVKTYILKTAKMGEEFYYMVCIILSGLLLFLSVYFMITLSDLESDYINSRECSSRLNFWTYPRIILQVCHTVLLVICRSWLLSFMSFPFTSWLVYNALKVPSGNSGLFDPTEIHIRQNLRTAIKWSLVFMAYHMISFFLYMYLLVNTLTADQDGSVAPKEVPW